MIFEKHKAQCFFVSALLLVLPSCTSLSFTPNRLSVPDIVKMSGKGMDSMEIVRRIAISGTVYRLDSDQIAKLKESGVPSPVLSYMQETYTQVIRKDSALSHDKYWQPLGEYKYGTMRAALIDEQTTASIHW